MKKVILIRYGEIFLKGKNRKFFEKALFQNIKDAILKFDAELVKVPGRLVVQSYKDEDELDLIDRLSKVCGIFSYEACSFMGTEGV